MRPSFCICCCGEEATYDFGDAYGSPEGFMQTAMALENTGVRAYDGAAKYIENPDLLTAAGTIVAVEARHAAYLNLIEPWWKILRSLALRGRRFATWEAVCQAVDAATQYWNAHRHPFVWGKRKQHRPARPTGIAALPAVA